VPENLGDSRGCARCVGDDRRASLEALRDVLAGKIDSASPHSPAIVAKQIAEIMAELGALPDPTRKNAVDDLAARRADRRTEAANGYRS
jgi:hypothetical protein